jgi:hypothetical protein
MRNRFKLATLRGGYASLIGKPDVLEATFKIIQTEFVKGKHFESLE